MDFPVRHLGANVPQARSAGSVFFLVSALLGHLAPALPSALGREMMTDVRAAAMHRR